MKNILIKEGWYDKKIIYYLILLYLIFCSAGLFIVNDSTKTNNYSTYLQLFNAILYFISIIIIYNKRKYTYLIIKNNLNFYLIFLFMLIILLSFLWSGNPILTLRKSIAMLGTTLVFISIFLLYMDDIFKLIYKSIYITMLLSLVYAIFLPNIAYLKDPRGIFLKGIFWHKNQFAYIAGLFLVMNLIHFCFNKKNKIINILLIILSIIFLNNAGCVGAVLATFISIIIFLIIYNYNKILNKNVKLIFIMFSFIVFFTIPIIAFISYSLSNDNNIFNLIGRDDTLTGRSLIWKAFIIYSFKEKPILGYGFESNDLLSVIGINNLISLAGFIPSHLHNSFLDVLFNLGLIGLIIFIFIFISSIYNQVINIKFIIYNYKKNVKDYIYFKNLILCLIILIFILIRSILETPIMKYNSFWWIIFGLINMYNIYYKNIIKKL
ncbi:O-antigen ligase family protein [Caldicellulosiruptoraceae bacterium PP1]